jgi:hypothetical protein
MTATGPTETTFGPLELFVVTFDGVSPDAGVLSALKSLGDGTSVRLVDLVIAVRLADGTVNVSELTDLPVDLSGAVDLVAEGLIGEEDIGDAVEAVPPGAGVALAAMEMRWAADLSSTLAAAGGHVAHIALVPGPVVNELVSGSLLASSNGEN